MIALRKDTKEAVQDEGIRKCWADPPSMGIPNAQLHMEQSPMKNI